MSTARMVRASFRFDGVNHVIYVDEREGHFEIVRKPRANMLPIARLRGAWDVEGRHPKSDPDPLLSAAAAAIQPKLHWR